MSINTDIDNHRSSSTTKNNIRLFRNGQLVRLTIEKSDLNDKLALIFSTEYVKEEGKYDLMLLKDDTAVPDHCYACLRKSSNCKRSGCCEDRKIVQIKTECITNACQYCRKSINFKLMLCSKCHMAAYCNEGCQKADWKRHKHKECPKFTMTRDLTKYPILEAVITNDLARIKVLVQQGCKVNVIALFDGNSPFTLAVMHGYLDVAQYLIEQGADKDHGDQEGNTALLTACANGRLPVVKYLIEQDVSIDLQNKFGATPLYFAAANGHLHITQFLIDHGCKKEEVDEKGINPLWIAAKFGKTDIVQYLLSQGVNKNHINVDGKTALAIATEFGHLPTVRCLKEHGADINIVNNVGHSPIYVAAMFGQLEVLSYLLKGGSDEIHISPLHDTSLLWIAAKYGHVSVVQYLLSLGARIDRPNFVGVTPLCIAAAHGHLPVVQLLVEYGAKGRLVSVQSSGDDECNKENIPNRCQCLNPLAIAARYDHKEVVQYLLSQGFDKNYSSL